MTAALYAAINAARCRDVRRGVVSLVKKAHAASARASTARFCFAVNDR